MKEVDDLLKRHHRPTILLRNSNYFLSSPDFASLMIPQPASLHRLAAAGRQDRPAFMPSRSIPHPISRFLRRFALDRRAGAAALVAAMIIPLVGFVGLSIDTARGYYVKARLSQALDAAALAGGRVFFDDDRYDDIEKFFDANIPQGFMGAEITLGPVPPAQPDDRSLTVSASAVLDTTFMRVLGIDTVTVAASSTVERADRGMELVLVMDITGSMYENGDPNPRIDDMKEAAHELVATLYGDKEEIPNFWVGLVPYTAAVNIGHERTDWLVPGYLDALDYSMMPNDPGGDEDYVPSGWKGCVEARWDDGYGLPRQDSTDAPPSVYPFTPMYAPSDPDPDHDNNYAVDGVREGKALNTTSNNGRGPNIGCGPEITSLVAARSAVEDAIDEMDSWHRGGTTSNVGLVWGWRVLSPKWRGLWGAPTPDELPLDYEVELIDKAVVILTDGMNQLWGPHSSDTDFAAYQRISAETLGTDSRNQARRELNERTLEICDAMKVEDIIIYTITFELPEQKTNVAAQEARDTFEDCATTPAHFFDNPEGEDLSDVFRTIAGQLANLRIAQ
ncbi:VWA domain-containing protein [Inquilinus sp. CAU 1745]|uniref:vWA domain-containing protein n=1 Tax=Inquilinus sp. CAU 1745 TaxID=3140369 RepID=UPI00325C30E5